MPYKDKQKNYALTKLWCIKHPERIREIQRKAQKKAYLKRKKEHPEILKAHDLANYHVPLASNCQKCGSIEHLERHHPNYEKPLDIITLCKPCHDFVHRSLNG